MDSITYLNRYRASLGEDGTPVALHRGLAGVTYKAEDIRTGRPVAVKVAPANSFDPAKLQRLEAVTRGVQSVNHPNVARLYDFGHVDPDVVLVTELLDGTTLDEWIGRHGPMLPAEVVPIAIQVISGLSALESHSLAHPLIQPSAVMLVRGQTSDGEPPAVKILPFGGVLHAASSMHSSTRVPSNSADFASPEQIKGSPVDFRSELYSLGCTMWFLLTGSPPGPGAADKGGRVPRSIRILLAQMVALDPSQRPQDLALLQEELRHCLGALERRHAKSAEETSPAAATLPEPAPAEPTHKTRGFPKSLAYAAAILLLVSVATLAVPQLLRWRAARTARLTGLPAGTPQASAIPTRAHTTSTSVARAAREMPAKTRPVAPSQTPPAIPAASGGMQTRALLAAPPKGPIAISSPYIPDAAQTADTADKMSGEHATSTNPPPVLVSVPEPSSSLTTDKPDAADAAIMSVGEGPAPMQSPAALNSVPRPAPPNPPAEQTAAVADRASGSPASQKPPPQTAATAMTTGESIARESTEPPSAARLQSTATAKATPSRKGTSSKSAPRSKKTRRTAEVSSKGKREAQREEVNRALPVVPSESDNPPVPEGSQRAKFLGTDANGNLVFVLPSNKRGTMAPATKEVEQPRGRSTRRVVPKPSPRSKMILKAEPLDAEDE